MDKPSQQKAAIAAAVALLGVIVAWRTCSSSKVASVDSAASGSRSEAAPSGENKATALSAPLAAAHVGSGDVIVAGLDVGARAIRVQRINSKDEVVAERLVLTDVAPSPEADLKLAASAEGVAVTWRGLRSGKLVRELVVLGADLAPKSEPAAVAATSCATRDAIWFSDRARATARPWSGPSLTVELPKEGETSLLCSPSRAYAVVEEEERTSVLALGADSRSAPTVIIREKDFGEDEQRELSEYTVGDDIGLVRLGASGAIALRELAGGALGPLHKLKTRIGKDDDVVAVDASSKVVVIAYTEDTSSSCPPSAGAGDAVAATKVMALRVDRQSFEESTVELSPGRCGHEVGPFFTGTIGDRISIAWAERAGGPGRSRAPIVALSHALVAVDANPAPERLGQAADALVDATCDKTTCYAVALARREGQPDGAGYAKVLRYR